MDRPLAFTLDDLEEYERGRGFILNPIEEWIPGEKIVSFEDYVEFVRRVVAGEDVGKVRRQKLTSRLHEGYTIFAMIRVVAGLSGHSGCDRAFCGTGM